MLFLGKFSRHKLIKIYTKLHYIFKIFWTELAYAPDPPKICMQLYVFLHENIAILYSRFFQNTHQNASIVKCFQKFRHENYPMASVYIKYLFFN